LRHRASDDKFVNLIEYIHGIVDYNS